MSAERLSIGAALLGALLLPGAASAAYVLEGIGVLDGMATEAAAVNDAGQVAGTQTGT